MAVVAASVLASVGKYFVVAAVVGAVFADKYAVVVVAVADC